LILFNQEITSYELTKYPSSYDAQKALKKHQTMLYNTPFRPRFAISTFIKIKRNNAKYVKKRKLFR